MLILRNEIQVFFYSRARFAALRMFSPTESYHWVHWDQLLLENCFDISYGSGAICYLVLVNFGGGVVGGPFSFSRTTPTLIIENKCAVIF